MCENTLLHFAVLDRRPWRCTLIVAVPLRDWPSAADCPLSEVLLNFPARRRRPAGVAADLRRVTIIFVAVLIVIIISVLSTNYSF